MIRTAVLLAASLVFITSAQTADKPKEAPVAAANDKIDRLIKQLGDDKFAKREAASKELDALGEKALTALHKATATNGDLEIRRRAECIIRSMAERAAKKELERFRGTWARVSENADVARWTLVYEGNKAHAYEGDRLDNKGVLKTDPYKVPKTYEYTPSEGSIKGETVLGIYELDGDTLRICYVCASSNRARPTEFSIGPKGGDDVSVWKRKKK
jgi:uncharacterized protein (TIGR03067 family)